MVGENTRVSGNEQGIFEEERKNRMTKQSELGERRGSHRRKAGDVDITKPKCYCQHDGLCAISVLRYLFQVLVCKEHEVLMDFESRGLQLWSYRHACMSRIPIPFKLLGGRIHVFLSCQLNEQDESGCITRERPLNSLCYVEGQPCSPRHFPKMPLAST